MSRLDDIAARFQSLTIGQGLQLTAELFTVAGDCGISRHTLAPVWNAWAHGDVLRLDGLPAPSAAPVETGIRVREGKSGETGIPLARFKALTGGFSPAEFREAAALPADEFEAARRVGFASYMQRRTTQTPSFVSLLGAIS